MARALHFTATLLSCAVALSANRALACGGCFGPVQQTAFTTVTGHRMAFAISDERTVLWDQFEYSGSPEDFSWVLPVRPGAFLEASTDAWFETLETVTKTSVTSPPLTCAQPSGGGCGVGSAQSDLASGSGGSFDPGVVVLHSGTVGPYETVTLRSTDGDALTAWLTQNGYAVPPDIEPTIAAYVSEGADFIALRLQPGQGISKMTPVRVVTPGGEFLLPLRMVAAGVGESVGIVLYVIGEQRYAMPDLREVFIDWEDLVYDFSKQDSNYLALRNRALGELDGFNYLVTFAHLQAFSRQFTPPGGFRGAFQAGNTFANNFADAYFAQARSNDGLSGTGCPSILTRLESDQLVDEAGATAFSCNEYTDIAASLIGLHPARVWVSRLELELPKAALTMDCILTPHGSDAEVEHLILATKSVNRPAGCPEPVFESRVAPSRPNHVSVWLALAGAVLGLFLRRRAAR